MNAVNIRIETSSGAINAELYPDAAPITVANFLHYVDTGAYDGGRFHRVVRLDNQSNTNLKVEMADGGMDASTPAPLPNDAIAIEVIQGGLDPAKNALQGAAIPLERTSQTGLAHKDGTLSMARRTVDSAITEFFICVNDQPSLDFGGQRNLDGQGFAAFGQVTSGMDVVRAIQRSPSDGQTLDPLIPITSITRVD
jgi:peptidyl-prolyl cis-trans isomerase A (cyclophilin A)